MHTHTHTHVCIFLWLELWLDGEGSAAAAKLFQSCPTLCNPIDSSSPGSPLPGILQARTLEWIAISFSNAWKWKVKVKSLGRVRLFMTPWTTAYQAPPSMGFSRQEYWSGVPSPFLRICYFKAKFHCFQTKGPLKSINQQYSSNCRFGRSWSRCLLPLKQSMPVRLY